MEEWPDILIATLILTGFVVLSVLFYKQSFAKTHKAWWIYTLLLFLVGFVGLIVVSKSGLLDAELAEKAKRPPPSLQTVSSEMPVSQVVLLAAAGIIWIGGVNVLVVWQRRRAGRSWWACFNPFGPIFRDFDGRTWLIFGLLFLLAMGLGMAALSMSPNIPGAEEGRSLRVAPNFLSASTETPD